MPRAPLALELTAHPAGTSIALSSTMRSGHIQTILVFVDGSTASVEALTQAARLAVDLGAQLDVLCVVGPDLSPYEGLQVQRVVDRSIVLLEGQLAGVRRRVIHGDPVRTVLQTAAEEGPDMIVVGTHGRVGRLHSLVGSVAEEIVRNAPCPVLTIRHGEEESFAERVHHRRGIADGLKRAV